MDGRVGEQEAEENDPDLRQSEWCQVGSDGGELDGRWHFLSSEDMSRHEYDDEKKVSMEGGEQRDRSMAHVVGCEQCEGSVPKVVKRVKKALRKFFLFNLRQSEADVMMCGLIYDCASKLAIKKIRRMCCDIFTVSMQIELLRSAVSRQVMDYNEHIGLVILSLLHWRDAARSASCLDLVCHEDFIHYDHAAELWCDGRGHEAGMS